MLSPIQRAGIGVLTAHSLLCCCFYCLFLFYVFILCFHCMFLLYHDFSPLYKQMTCKSRVWLLIQPAGSRTLFLGIHPQLQHWPDPN